MKKVLIITYYWPPSGGAGVQRWLKFVKYLDQFGCKPIVFTPENPERPVLDMSLLKDVPKDVEVVKIPIWEPYNFYRRFLGLAKDEKVNTGFLSEKKERAGLFQRLSVWIRGNIFIPDARIFWVKPAVRFLSRYLQSNDIRSIITTGPPHSMHLIGLELKKQISDLNWIADFRDPWTNIDYYDDLMLTKASDRKHHELEEKVIHSANTVISVGPDIANDLENRYGVPIEVITNGYDEDEFSIKYEVLSDKLYLTHLGTMVKTRNPIVLWKALEVLMDEHPELVKKIKVRLVGKTDISVKQEIINRKLEQVIEYVEYVPHEKVPEYLMSSALLLLVINDTPNSKGILTGKLFEYLASRRPMVCIGPKDGDAAAVINECGSGVVFDNYMHKELADHILNRVREHFQGGGVAPVEGDINKYSRSQQAMKLISLIEGREA